MCRRPVCQACFTIKKGKSGGQLIADHRFGFFILESSQTDYELQGGEVSSDGLDTFTSESKTADSLWLERQ